MNLIDILEGERELNKKIDTLSDRIFSLLHTIDDMEMNPEWYKKGSIEEEKELLEKCRTEKESLQEQLKRNHVQMRYCLLNLFREVDR